MIVNDPFTSGRERPGVRRKEAARLRGLAANATTDRVKKHLEDRKI
jgi:hypothetical protein